MSLTKAQEQRVIDLSTYCQRLASVLNIPAVELLDALNLCSLTLEKDKHNVVNDHMDLIVWVQHKGEAT